jgi:L-aminopeptidase/D-esterase-like protein
VRVGHAHDARFRTGVTVIVPDAPAVMAVDVRGGGPGTRETDALDPSALVERVHGLALAGGSVFGLAAADGLACALSDVGIGLPMGPGVPPVPVIPAAILFDLANGGDKAWGRLPPYFVMAEAAFAALGQPFASGPTGAGYGARAGSRPGGLGSVSQSLSTGHINGAIIATNSFGEVYEGAPPSGPVPMPKTALARQNTCIGAVATNAPLTRAQARRVAIMAQDGLARAVRPVHSPFDGDTIFVISTAPEAETAAGSDPITLTEIGTIAADLVADAVRAGVIR